MSQTRGKRTRTHLRDLADTDLRGAVQGDMAYYDGADWLVVGGVKADGKMPAIQADGTVAWEAQSGGGSVDRVVLPGMLFGPTAGAGAQVTLTAREVGLSFDPTTPEGAAYSGVFLPSGWATVDISLHWSNNAGGGGNVVWAFFMNAFDNGDNLAVSGVLATQTVAVGSADDLVVTSMATGYTVPAGAFLNCRVNRSAGNAADTYGSDAILLAVVISESA